MKKNNLIVDNSNSNSSNEMVNELTINVFGNAVQVNESLADFVIMPELETFLQKINTVQYEVLYDDIKKVGIHSPIIYIVVENKKLVIDGHIRLRIAKELKLEDFPKLEILEPIKSIEGVKVWMVKNQCQRRNLSKNVRVRIAYALKESIAQIAQLNLVKAGKNEVVDKKVDTLEELAKIAGVSRTTIARYQSVLEKGTEEVKNKMLEGDISINNAYQEVKENLQTVGELHYIINDSLKPNYSIIHSVKEGTAMMKSGDLDCILIVPKGKESMVEGTNLKTGLMVIE